MIPIRRLGTGLLSAAMLALAAGAAAAQPVTWFAALPDSPQGYVSVFEKPGEWPRAMNRAKVFQLHLGILSRLPDARLRDLVALLPARHMQLALVVQILPLNPVCAHTEAFSTDDFVFGQLDRVRQAGADVRHILFDEPVWYAGGDDKRPGCTLPAARIAELAAVRARRIRSMFPEADISDIEPADTPADRLATFLDVLKRDGIPVTHVHADIHWDHDWAASLRAWQSVLTPRHAGLGLIIDGGTNEGDDVSWETAALQHERDALAVVRDPPGLRLIFQSWRRLPTRYIPENEPGTLTHLMATAPN